MRARRKPLRFEYPTPSVSEFFPPLGEEAFNANQYDLLHKRRYGASASIKPGTSSLTSRILTSPSPLPAVSSTPSGTSKESKPCTNHIAPSPPPLADFSPRLRSRPSTNSCSSNIQCCPTIPGRMVFAIQWNINGFFNNLPDLEIQVHKLRPVVLALQETHKASVSAMNNSLGKGYTWIAKSGHNKYHSVALGISSELNFSEITLDTDLPIVAARILWPFPVSVVSFYLPNGKIPNLKNILKKAMKTIPQPIVLLGDCNGHHQAWGSRVPNARGALVAQLASSCGLTILNDGSPTFIRKQVQTSIDISLVSTTILNRLHWTAGTDPLGSDHVPITLNLDATPPETSRRPRWIFEKANWTSFQESLESEIENTRPKSISELTETIIKTASATIPKTSSTPGRRALYWWNDSIKKVVKARRKALRAAKRLPECHPEKEAANQAYREARNYCRQMIREAKEKSWTDFLNGINEHQSATELWSRVNRINGKRRVKGMALTANGATTRDPEEIADALADHFYEISSFQRYSSTFLKKHPSPDQAVTNFVIPPGRGQNFNLRFTMKELDFALQKATGKSVGPDEIGYPMIKNLPEVGKRALLDAINKEWTEGTFPDEWRQGFVVPIPKGSGPANAVNSYRPITLTSCMAKLMERMVNRRLVEHLETNQRLDQRQHAFRAGQGTGTYLATLGQVLNDAFSQGEHIEIASLDLAKAYNRAWTPGVLQQLVKWGITGNLLLFIKQFLSNRTFQVIIGNTKSKSTKEETGVPQGSVLAVTLFLVAINSVFDVLPKGIFIFVYADDILLVVCGSRPKVVRRKLQTATNAVAKWADLTGFDISSEKCARLHICSSSHIPPRKPITIHGKPIPTKKAINVLGITLDRNLSFKKHFEITKKKCKSRVNLMKVISNRCTINDRSIRKRVANAIVCSRLFYGIEITCRAFDQLVQQLEPIYNNTIRSIAGLLPSTPANAVVVESGVLPFRYKTAIAVCNRAISFLEHTKDDGSVAFIASEANRILTSVADATLPPVVELHRNGPRSWQARSPKIDRKIENHFRKGGNPIIARALFLERLRTRYPHSEIIYSDGSKAAGKVGIGVHGTGFQEHRSLADQCSVFTAEAAALLVAISRPFERPVLIATDSASTLLALESSRANHPWIQAAQDLIDDETKNVTLTWIPGHTGIPGNEKADALANLGRTSRRLTRGVPGADAKHWVKTTVQNSWAEEWRTNRSLFIRKIKGTTDAWEDRQTRREQVVLSRLRTGHTRTSHDYTGGTSFRKTCETCGVFNSVEHMICECPTLEQLRTHYQIGSIRNALNNDEAGETILICFLKDAGLFTQI